MKRWNRGRGELEDRKKNQQISGQFRLYHGTWNGRRAFEEREIEYKVLLGPTVKIYI